MRTPTLFLVAILTPVILCTSLLGPSYASIVGASYIVYLPEAGGPHPMAGKLFDVFYIIDTYRGLVDYWSSNYKTLDIVKYTLPIIALPLAGCTFALWLTHKIARKLLNFFQLSASVA